MGWRKAVEEDLLGPWQMWPLSCYAHTATNPGPVKNDVEGAEMSMEELRWQDLQALRAGQSGQALQQAFQAAATQQKQLYQVCSAAALGLSHSLSFKAPSLQLDLVHVSPCT